MCLTDIGIHPVGFIDLSYGVKLRNKTLRVLMPQASSKGVLRTFGKNPKGLRRFIWLTVERPVPGFSPAFAWIIR